MHKESSGLMRSAATLLRILIVANLLCLLLFLAILVLSFAGQALVLDALRKGQPGIDADASLVAVRLVMLIGMAVVALAHAVLSRLRQIVDTVRAGDPFVPGNAARLTAIAWALLGMQMCDLAFGAVSIHAGIDRWSQWQFSVTGWLAVVLLFVLAKVFEHGARLREDVAGTV